MKYFTIVHLPSILKIVLLLCFGGLFLITHHSKRIFEGNIFTIAGNSIQVSYQSGTLNDRYYISGNKQNVTLPPLLKKYRKQMNYLLKTATIQGDQKVLDNLAEFARTSDEEYLSFLEIQFRRLRSALQDCDRTPVRYPSPFYSPGRMQFENSHHLAYCVVSKAASRTVLQQLHAFSGYALPNSMMVLAVAARTLPRLANLDSNDYFVMTSVRHPFKRLVSAYKDRIINPEFITNFDLILQNIIDTYSLDSNSFLSTYLKLLLTENSSSNLSGEEFIKRVPKHFKNRRKNLSEIFTNPTKVSKQSANLSGSYSRNHQDGLLSPGKEKDILRVPSFRQFAHHAIHVILNCRGNIQCLMKVEPHIAPYSHYCSPCFLQNDFIFKVETIDEDLKMLKELFMDPLIVSQEVRDEKAKEIPFLEKMYSEYSKIYSFKNKQFVEDAHEKRPVFSYEEYMDQLSDLDIDLLYTAYYKDFKLFNYEPWY